MRGATYSANDAELQKWTAATLFMAFIVVHETFLDLLARADEEALMVECAVFAGCLDMPIDIWPRALGEFYGPWDERIENARVGDQARELCEILMNNGVLPWYMRMGLPVVGVFTARWLPARLRREYGLPDPNTWFRKLAYIFVVTLIGWMYWFIPDWMKELWHQRNMRNRRRAVAQIRRSGRWSI